MPTPAEFYDALASDYHLLFPDWWAAAEWHGRVVAEVLAAHQKGHGRLLDCTCGIGTQALPLARLGYDVTAADVSGAAVERARQEAAARGIDVTFAVSDVREVRKHVDGDFDVVISCDNALPHLLDDDDLREALDSIHGCLRPGGLLLASVRDYDSLRRDRPAGVPVTVHSDGGTRHGSGQWWAWTEDGEYLDIELFTFTEQTAGSWSTRSRSTRYRALLRSTLDRLLVEAGFGATTWLTPEESGYYQPIVVAHGLE